MMAAPPAAMTIPTMSWITASDGLAGMILTVNLPGVATALPVVAVAMEAQTLTRIWDINTMRRHHHRHLLPLLSHLSQGEILLP